jgi:glutamine amidotransferase
MMSDDNINPSLCNYGTDFVASFEIDNIAGVQFHPELSQHNGLNLLKNFIEKF